MRLEVRNADTRGNGSCWEGAELGRGRLCGGAGSPQLTASVRCETAERNILLRKRMKASTAIKINQE